MNRKLLSFLLVLCLGSWDILAIAEELDAQGATEVAAAEVAIAAVEEQQKTDISSYDRVLNELEERRKKLTPETEEEGGTVEEQAEGLTLELLQLQISACQDGSGAWKREPVKIEGMDEEFDCTQLAQLEFDLLKKEGGEEFDEYRALQCVTRDWHVSEQVDFARHLEDLGQLQKPLAEHFNCPGKQEDTSSCVKDLSCNLFKSIPMVGVMDMAGVSIPGCPKDAGAGSCLSEVVWGVWKNLIGNIEGVWELAKMGVGAVKDGAVKAWRWATSWARDSKPAEDATSVKQLFIENQPDSFFTKFLKDPIGTVTGMVGNFFKSMGNFIGDAIKDNFGCMKWSGSRANVINPPKCEEPLISTDCATCGQKLNMACGVVGFLGGEVLTAFLTGGAVNVAAKAGSAVGKAASLGTKYLSGIGSRFAAKQLPTLSSGVRHMGSLGGKAGGAIVRAGSFTATWIGGKLIKHTPSFTKGALALLRGGKLAANGAGKMVVKTLGVVTSPWPVRKYLEVLEDAFILGQKGRSGLKAHKLAREISRQADMARMASKVKESAKGMSPAVANQANNVAGASDELYEATIAYKKAVEAATKRGDDASKAALDAAEARMVGAEKKYYEAHTKLAADWKAHETKQLADLEQAKRTREGAIEASRTRVAEAQRQRELAEQGARQAAQREADLAAEAARRADEATNAAAAANRADDAATAAAKADDVKALPAPSSQADEVLALPAPVARGDDVLALPAPVSRADDFAPVVARTDDVPARFGAKGDEVDFSVVKANGQPERIRGRITNEGPRRVVVETPDGSVRYVDRSQVDVGNTRNLYETRNTAFANASEGAPVRFSMKGGEDVSGTVVGVNNKSVRVRLADGTEETFRTRNMKLDSVDLSTQRALPAPAAARRTVAETPAAATSRLGAKGDDVDVLVRKPGGQSERIQGKIRNEGPRRIVVETADGKTRYIDRAQVDAANTRNLFEIPNTPLAAAETGSRVSLNTLGGEEVRGTIAYTNQKSVRVVFDDGSARTIRTRDIKFDSVAVTAPNPAELASLPAVRSVIDDVAEVSTKLEAPPVTSVTTTSDKVVDIVAPGASVKVTPAAASKLKEYAFLDGKVMDVTDASGKVFRDAKLVNVVTRTDGTVIHVYSSPVDGLVRVNVSYERLAMQIMDDGSVRYLKEGSEEFNRLRSRAVRPRQRRAQAPNARTAAGPQRQLTGPEAKAALAGPNKQLALPAPASLRLVDGSSLRGKIMATTADNVLIELANGTKRWIPWRGLGIVTMSAAAFVALENAPSGAAANPTRDPSSGPVVPPTLTPVSEPAPSGPQTPVVTPTEAPDAGADPYAVKDPEEGEDEGGSEVLFEPYSAGGGSGPGAYQPIIIPPQQTRVINGIL